MSNVQKPQFNLVDLKARCFHWLDRNKPIMLISGPGLGKSEFLKNIAVEREADYFTLPAAGLVPSHIMGFQFPDKTSYVSLADKVLNYKGNELIVHIQDFIQAPDTIQALLMNLVLTRQINNINIPDNVVFVIDSNRPEDNAGGAKVIEPFKTRAMIVDYPIDVNGWLTWGIRSKRIDIETLCFIKVFPDQLYRFKPSRSIEAYPCPRTWEKASQDVTAGFTDIPTLAANVGYESATDFSLWLANFSEFRSFFDSVINNPLTAKLYDDMGKRYYACSILANKMNKKHIDKIVTYLKRYKSKELLTFTIELGCSINPESKETKTYQSLFV